MLAICLGVAKIDKPLYSSTCRTFKMKLLGRLLSSHIQRATYVTRSSSSVSADVAAYIKATTNGKHYPQISMGFKVDFRSLGAMAISSLKKEYGSGKAASQPFEIIRLFQQFQLDKKACCGQRLKVDLLGLCISREYNCKTVREDVDFQQKVLEFPFTGSP